jgi:hypothetical protein
MILYFNKRQKLSSTFFRRNWWPGLSWDKNWAQCFETFYGRNLRLFVIGAKIFYIRTVSIMTFSITIKKCDTQHNDIQHNDIVLIS